MKTNDSIHSIFNRNMYINISKISPVNKEFTPLVGKTLAVLVATISVVLPSIASAQDCVPNLKRTAPDSRYTDQQDGTVKDNFTGLIWQRCSIGQTWNSSSNSCTGTAKELTWQEALSQSKALGDGWRLPNIKELNSLTEYSCSDPNINKTIFPPPTDDLFFGLNFWSSTPRKGLIKSTDDVIYYVTFSSGTTLSIKKVPDPSQGISIYARAVKSGI